MKIYSDKEVYRELTQLSWAIFRDADGTIESEIKDGFVTTKISLDGKEYFDKSPYFEKNSAKRSLYNASKDIDGFYVPWGILTGINPSKLATENFSDMMENFLVDEFRSKLCIEINDVTKSIKTEKNDISLYVGIPFCKTKCKYCSFISNAVEKNNKIRSKYIDCLLREIEASSKCIKNRKLKSIYIGGGTPTALEENDLERLLKAIKENFNFENLLEYTVEAGRVDTITHKKLDDIKKYGATRISINPQVFDDEILQKIGRNHTVEQVFDAYNYAKTLGFNAINMDIIYGLGGDFYKTVDTLFSLNPENVTMHTLAIKNGSNITKEFEKSTQDVNYFYKKAKEYGYAPYYLYRQQYMTSPYENVGYHKHDTKSYYNIVMMENLTDILAVGSGTTTKISGESLFNNKYPLDYINNIENILIKKQHILKEKDNGI